jgi:hypothetical protein
VQKGAPREGYAVVPSYRAPPPVNAAVRRPTLRCGPTGDRPGTPPGASGRPLRWCGGKQQELSMWIAYIDTEPKAYWTANGWTLDRKKALVSERREQAVATLGPIWKYLTKGERAAVRFEDIDT